MHAGGSWRSRRVGDYSQYDLAPPSVVLAAGHRADCRIFLNKNVKDIIQYVVHRCRVFEWSGFQVDTPPEAATRSNMC